LRFDGGGYSEHVEIIELRLEGSGNSELDDNIEVRVEAGPNDGTSEKAAAKSS
jgi:hypothetical protein